MVLVNDVQTMQRTSASKSKETKINKYIKKNQIKNKNLRGPGLEKKQILKQAESLLGLSGPDFFLVLVEARVRTRGVVSLTVSLSQEISIVTGDLPVTVTGYLVVCFFFFFLKKKKYFLLFFIFVFDICQMANGRHSNVTCAKIWFSG